MDEKEILLEEWKEIRETLRSFGHRRLAQLTVFMAAEGAAISAFLNPSATSHRVVFQTAGLLLVAIFFIMERGCVDYWQRAAVRGKAIEAKLKPLELMTEHRPEEKELFTATNATYFLYIITAVFWIVSFGSWGAPVPSENLRIIVAGDGRAQYPPPSPYPFKSPRAEDQDGLNRVITKEIVQAVIDEKAKMLLWTGDLTNVSEGDPVTFERQLLAWRDIVQPLYDQGITVLPVRGNHEAVWYDPKDSTHTARDIPHPKKIWDEVFSGGFALPANGPRGEENVSFYDVRASTLVVGIDHYVNSHSVNRAWLKRVLEEQKRPFIFVYGHEPAFSAGHHPDDETLAADPLKRNEFWESLIRAGARVYFCGHDHFYDHMLVTRDGADAGPEMHQLTAGTAGAPFYEQGNYNPNAGWKLNCVHHAKTYGYILVEIERNKATMTFKGRMPSGKYELIDSFSYMVSPP